MTEEGLANLYWAPSDCSSAAIQILLSTITYDITPPTLSIVQTSSKGNTTLAQTASTRVSRRLQYFTVSPTSSSSKTYGASVVFRFSEAVQGFGPKYAFIHRGQLSSAGLNESVSQTQFSATIVADSTESALVLVTGSELSSCPAARMNLPSLGQCISGPPNPPAALPLPPGFLSPFWGFLYTRMVLSPPPPPHPASPFPPPLATYNR